MILMVIAAQTLSQLGIIVSIAAVIVPAVWWVAHRVRSSIRSELIQQLEASSRDAQVKELTDTLNSLDAALRVHMQSEEETNSKIEALGRGLVSQLRKLESNLSANQVNMLKAVMTHGETPTLLHEVWPGGYQMLWANRSYLTLAGLTMAEALAGGEWLAIEESERELVKAAAEHAGQTGQDYDGEYTLVNAKTQKLIGCFEAHGHYLQGPDDHGFYLSMLVACAK